MTRYALAPALLLASASGAMAQDTGPVQRAATAGGSGFFFEFTPRGSYTFDADIDDTDGSVSIWRAGFGLGFSFQPWERARIILGVDQEASWYLFDDATGLIPTAPADGDPFELGLTTTFAPRLSVQHDERWGWFVGGIISFSGDPNADLADTGTYGGLLGARYSFSENFALTFGLAAKTRLEDDILVIPLIGIDWQITDRVSFTTEGTVGSLNTKLSDEWTASLSAGWELREFRLDDDAPLPDGVLGDSRVPISLRFAWSPSPQVTLSLTGGAVVWQEFEFRDDGGNDVSETNTDPTGFIGMSAKFRF